MVRKYCFQVKGNEFLTFCKGLWIEVKETINPYTVLELICIHKDF